MAGMSDSRRRILERRAAFVAAALSTVAPVGCEKQPPATATREERDARHADAGPADTGAGNTGASTVIGPEPCLSPPPAPCLSVAKTVDAGPPDAPRPPGPMPCLKMPPPNTPFD